VTVLLDASDNSGGSGVASTHYNVDGGTDQAGTSVSVSGDGTHTISYYSVDNAGNKETPHDATVKIDTTPPTINATRTSANAAGWNNGPVTVKYACSDAGSGINSCSPDAVLSSDGGHQSASGEAVDQAGNKATVSVSDINIDTVKPIITLAGGGTYTIDQNVTIGCTATDALSGIANSTCASVSGTKSALDYGMGTTTVNASGSDNADNTGSDSTTVTVRVTADSLCALTTRLLTKMQLANSFCAKTSQKTLDSFRNEVSAQSGQALSTADANTLIAASKFLG
jgi:large repetitive protein